VASAEGRAATGQGPPPSPTPEGSRRAFQEVEILLLVSPSGTPARVRRWSGSGTGGCASFGACHRLISVTPPACKAVIRLAAFATLAPGEKKAPIRR